MHSVSNYDALICLQTKASTITLHEKPIKYIIMGEKTNYDRAIEAYQFQVNRYHTWMNYYSLFHGALLVAFYSVLDKVCDSIQNTAGESLCQWVPFIIALLGFITGICWCYTVIGNKTWINNWMFVIRKAALESGETKESVIYNQISSKCTKCIKASGSVKYKGVEFLSTQKVMLIFTLAVTIAWGAVTYFCFPLEEKCIVCTILIVLALVAIGLFFWDKSFIHSKIDEMNKFD